MKKLLFKSSTFRFLEISISIAISILLTPFLIYHLGDKNYGLWVLILATLGWFKFVDLGFSYAVHRNIVIALAENNNERINSIFSVALTLFAVLGVIATSGVLLLAYFPHLLGINEESIKIASISLSILAIKVFWDFLMNCLHGFFSAYLRMDIDANLSSLNTIIRSVLIYFLIKDMNIYGAVIATMVADAFTYVLKIFYAKRLHPELSFNRKLVSFVQVRELFAFSKHVIATVIAKSINGKVDPLIITHLLGLKMVALYSVTSRLVTMVESLVTAIVGVFQPIFTRKVASGESVDNIFKQILGINFFVVVILFTPLGILAEDFINLWVGKEYAQYSDIVFILSFAYICRTISRPIASVLLAQAKHRLLSVINFTGAITNIMLSIWFGTYWGITGIAIATTIGFFISDVILHLFLYKHHCQQKITPLLSQFFLTTSIFVALVYIGQYSLSQYNPLTWLELILAALIIETIVLTIGWLFLLPKFTKEIITQYIAKKYSILQSQMKTK